MKVACLIDAKRKTQHDRVMVLQKLFPDITFDPIVANRKFKNKAKDYDIIYYCSHGLFSKCPVKHKSICASITSHKSIDNANDTRNILRRIHRVSTNNKYLYKYFKAKNVFYIPNGVDTDKFSPVENKLYDPDNIRLGWVGNRDRATKNFSIVRKLSKMSEFRFSIIATLKSKPFKKNKDQMLLFYESIDFLLVTSSTEGTPNPALEAASCGVPIIATSVGNMPDLINDGSNGFIVERPRFHMFKNVLINRVKILDIKTYSQMSRSIRDSIIKEWKWKYRKNKYKKFLFG